MIVGGGIGGAVLALMLGQAERHVVLLERELKPHAAGRPEVLAQSTLNLFKDLGAGERILKEAAIPLRGLELYQPLDRLLLHFSSDDFRQSGAQPYSVDPTRTREILLQTAESNQSVEVRRGVEVREVIREAGQIRGVRATSGDQILEWRSPLVIGDDGGKSRLREALGIPLKVQEFPFEFLGAAGPELPHGKPGMGQAWLEPKNLAEGIFGGVFLPQPEKRTAFVFLVSSKSRAHFMESDPSRFHEAARALSGRSEKLAEQYPFPKAFTVFKRPFGHAPCYVADGAALLGDAAHPMTPAGGQGANGSVADAVALGRVALKAFHNNDFSRARLSEYERVRRPANQRSLGFSIAANRVFRFLKFFPWGGNLLVSFLGRVERNSKMKTQFLQNVSTAFR